VTIYQWSDPGQAPRCPYCGGEMILVRARLVNGRTWPALCCKRCEYWRTYRGLDSLKKPERRGRIEDKPGAEK